MLIPQCSGFPATGIPSEYYNRSYRACIVGRNGANFYFRRWVAGENWEFTPTGVAILEVDSDEGVGVASGRIAPVNTDPTTISPTPLPVLPPNKGIDFSDVGGDSSVKGCAAIIFRPNGRSTGVRFIELGEGVYSAGSAGLIMTNISPKAFISIHVQQHTGRVAYEQGPE